MLVQQTAVHSSNNSVREKQPKSVETLPPYLHRISTLTPATMELYLDFLQSESPIRDGRKHLP